MIDWCELQDAEGAPATWIPDLLDRIERQPTAELWQELRHGLGVIECETWCRVSFAAIPRIAAIAEQSRGDDREEALDLAADIARSLVFYRDADDLVRSARDAYATLHRLAAESLADRTGIAFVQRLQAALAFAGHTLWATVGMDYSDEHYGLDCPHCARQIFVVIGRYGCYSAIRH
ncbi:hypothetical protein [Cryptosporangium aurantiacum]|uniref:Uncharacterized protein n=1 Tax=Cryptosporangium aurantiacum TaxID=134849 RepID=A0A1M7RJ72_9ACTN|nr:hypothetical protein [Cryptosporangium aurantiacum]SHN46314.1 hypothetical protein SAMN05443668_114148 [Cryptosporangium aurantiacum]